MKRVRTLLARSLVLALLLLALVFSACAGGPITPVATPADGGTALVAWQEPATLDLLYAPGVQSAVVMHVEAQSASVRHDVPNFDEAPRVQRFPPASPGLAPVSVTVVPVHEALTIELP